jgi:hypothetical protein
MGGTVAGTTFSGKREKGVSAIGNARLTVRRVTLGLTRNQPDCFALLVEGVRDEKFQEFIFQSFA